jgi:hypothetical protein
MARLARDLPRALRHPLTVPAARAILAQRLVERPGAFLGLMRDAVYDHAPSVYRRMLRHVGCEYGDLERLVRQDDVEGALRRLLDAGVYLTVDESRGRQPVVRGSLSLRVDPPGLANPLARGHVPVSSSGSRGEGRTVLMDLACIRDHGVNTALALEGFGGTAWVKAVWAVPGGAALYRILKLSSFGRRVTRWFTQVDVSAPGLHPRYRWSHRLVRWISLAAGAPLPAPEHAPLDDPSPVARWMASVVQEGATPWIRTLPSSAVRACRAAMNGGIDLTGAYFTVSGEPVTAAKVEAIRRSGAQVTPRYGSMETGPIGYGCLAPEAPDDVHLFHDMHAVVQPPGDSGLFVSSLGRFTPLVMLNLSLGDQATLRRRGCGCPLEAQGWPTHLQAIVSREKLTAAGMTFYDSDVIRVLESVLPARFGGGPTDYQLVEDETEGGDPRIRLLVHPALGPMDPATVAEAFLSAIGSGAGAERLMGAVWRDARLLQIDRRPPLRGASGKILHVHVARPAAAD